MSTMDFLRRVRALLINMSIPAALPDNPSMSAWSRDPSVTSHGWRARRPVPRPSHPAALVPRPTPPLSPTRTSRVWPRSRRPTVPKRSQPRRPKRFCRAVASRSPRSTKRIASTSAPMEQHTYSVNHITTFPGRHRPSFDLLACQHIQLAARLGEQRIDFRPRPADRAANPARRGRGRHARRSTFGQSEDPALCSEPGRVASPYLVHQVPRKRAWPSVVSRWLFPDHRGVFQEIHNAIRVSVAPTIRDETFASRERDECPNQGCDPVRTTAESCSLVTPFPACDTASTRVHEWKVP